MDELEPDDLTAKLQSWRVSPRLPASFQRDVWSRISARQAARRDTFFQRLTRAFGALIVQPQYAVSAVVVSLSLGIGAAHLQARQARNREWKALEERYSVSIDPVAMMSSRREGAVE